MKRLFATGLLVACAQAPTAWPYRDGSPAITGGSSERVKEPIELATQAGLPRLSAVQLPPGDIEVRFWFVPAFAAGRGIAIRKSGSSFRAIAIDIHGSRLATPSRSWRSVWESLTADGILTLPDESSLPSDGVTIVDGWAYVIEAQHEGVYSSSTYSDPAEHAWPQATSILRIAHLIARTFQIPIDDRSPEVRARVPDTDIDTRSHALGAPCDPLDITETSRCGVHGRNAVLHSDDVRAPAPCELKPLRLPNPAAWTACTNEGRVYVGSSDNKVLLVVDVAEMTDDQRTFEQRMLGLRHDKPLRTIAEWRAVLTR